MTIATESDEFATEASFGYRRGFVLGLTLAEAALLLVFVVMLLLVVGFDRRDRQIQVLEKLREVASKLTPPGQDPAESMANQLAMLSELRKAAEASGHKWDKDFVELVRAVARTPYEDGLVDARQAIELEGKRLQQIVEQLQKEAGGKQRIEMATALADKDSAISNYRGQLVALRDKLMRSGKGGDLPSCWMTKEGKIDYILDVVLDPDGIRVRESYPAYRQQERDRLPLPKMRADTLYARTEFLDITRALFDWSAKSECRFYVVVYDGTGSDQKELYKDLLRTVEGHFYKREERRAPPF